MAQLIGLVLGLCRASWVYLTAVLALVLTIEQGILCEWSFAWDLRCSNGKAAQQILIKGLAGFAYFCVGLCIRWVLSKLSLWLRERAGSRLPRP